MVEGVKVSNGLAWSADARTLYHSDSRGPWIDRWDFHPTTGAISNRRRIVTLTESDGRPDGGATDIEGGYWSCGVSAGCLNRFAPDGRLLARYDLPIPAPTMCAFGGADMRTLFITSARQGTFGGSVGRRTPIRVDFRDARRCGRRAGAPSRLARWN